MLIIQNGVMMPLDMMIPDRLCTVLVPSTQRLVEPFLFGVGKDCDRRYAEDVKLAHGTLSAVGFDELVDGDADGFPGQNVGQGEAEAFEALGCEARGDGVVEFKVGELCGERYMG